MARRDVVLVDDGIATGVTALAALRALRLLEPKRLVLGVPICAGETAEPLRAVADEVVCAEVPEKFGSVGHWYEDFSPTTDDEVLDLLARPADARRAAR
jgi:predicted phosphoribosyltransferase